MEEINMKYKVECGQKTSRATQWSHSTPVLLPIVEERNGPHMQQVGQGQHALSMKAFRDYAQHR